MTPTDLCASLKQFPNQAMRIPHHPAADWGGVSAATDWPFHDDEVERLAEIMLDAEIYVDRIADMRVNDMNAVLEAVRQMALMKNGGEENDLHLRTLEVAQIREDEYFGSLIADDLKGILRDIRNEHRPDTMTADETSLVATVQGQLQEAMNFEGSSEEKQIRAFMATIGLDYDTLTKEEFVSIISGIKKSKYLKSPLNQRGKARPQLPHGKGKKKRR